MKLKHIIQKGMLGICILSLYLGCEEVISVADISEEEITILAPVDGVILEDNSVTFSWEELEFADQYQLQVATPDFNTASQLVEDTIVGDSTQTVRNFTTTLTNDNYQWRIRGLNSNFQTPYTTRSFSVNNSTSIPLSEQQVVLLHPEDGLETTDTNITLEWEALEDATLYRIVVTNTTDNTSFFETSGTATQVDVTFVPGSYTWAVRAENTTQNTAFTERILTVIE